MFQKIQQLIDDKDALVFVLIDEVIICLLETPLKLEFVIKMYFFLICSFIN